MNAGHNSRVLTDLEEKALFFHHVRKDAEVLAKIKALQNERKANRKLAQADDFALADIDYAQRAMGAADKGTITDRFSQQGKVLFWLGLNPGYQADLFVDRSPALERIEAEGERAGWLAIDRESPYGPKSDEETAWLRGYDRAQRQAAENLQSAMEKANAKRDELIKGHDTEDPDFEEAA